jgi:quinol monooxygenase YgiN
MFLTIVRIFPSAKEREAVRGYLGALLRSVRAQPGCIDCSLSTELDPDALVLSESWEAKKDLVRRLQSAGYAKVLATMEMSVRKPEVFIYEVVRQNGLEFIENVRMAAIGENPAA